jgi:hypothetical protein
VTKTRKVCPRIEENRCSSVKITSGTLSGGFERTLKETLDNKKQNHVSMEQPISSCRHSSVGTLICQSAPNEVIQTNSHPQEDRCFQVTLKQQVIGYVVQLVGNTWDVGFDKSESKRAS